jgi:hypothetical protein
LGFKKDMELINSSSNANTIYTNAYNFISEKVFHRLNYRGKLATILLVASCAALILYRYRMTTSRTIDERVSLLQHQYADYIQTIWPDTSRSGDYFQNSTFEKPLLLIFVTSDNALRFFQPDFLKTTVKEKLVTKKDSSIKVEPFVF